MKIYMRKPRGKRAAFQGTRDSSSNKERECLRYPNQEREIRLEYLIEIVNAFNIEFLLDYVFGSPNTKTVLIMSLPS